MALSQKDVEKLLKDSSKAVRQEVLLKVISQYNDMGPNAFTIEENNIVEAIFSTLLKAPEKVDRAIMAERLQECGKLPKEIVLTMAQDIMIEIAGPILRYSPILNEKDLLKLIEGTNDKKRLLAIAQRDPLSEKITDALFKKEMAVINMAILSNIGSEISDKTYLELLKEGSKVNQETIQAIVDKGLVSVVVAEKLLFCVEGDAKATLDEKYEVRFENKQLKKDLEKRQKQAALKAAELRTNSNKKA